MTSSRRALALLTTTLLAAGTMLMLGASAATALPNGFAVPVGAPVNISVSATNVTFTQTTPVAVVEATTLDVALGETFDIVQPDPGMLMVVRNTGGSPVQWNGAITADANLLVLGTAGINVNGTVTTGGDLVLSTGDTTNAGAVLPFVPLTPSAASGAVSIGTTGDLLAGGNLGIAGNDITVAGSVHAAGSSVSIVSDDDVEYPRDDTGSGLISDGTGFVGGVVQTTPTANVTASGVVLIEASAPSTAVVDGNLAGDGEGTIIGEGVPGVVAVIGTSASNDGQFDALANSAGPAGGQLGAHMFGGESTPFTSDTPFQLVSYGEIAPSASVVVVPHITLLEELEVGFFMQCSTLEEPEEAGSPTVPSYIDFLLLGALFDGGAIAPGGETLPNQAPIVVPGLGTVAINEQVKTVVDGWEILTGTALHIVTTSGDDIRLGVVECAQPAVLAATGADRADAQLGVAGAVMLALAGIVLVLGRRRRIA